VPKPIKTDEIRAAFMEFFQQLGHRVYPSDSLVPTNDPSLLFTGSGMNQFKDAFLGKGNLGFTRCVTSQKCLRVPDIENVGRTTDHHTFFEMLGNFSFGDYFKDKAIAWAWEFSLDVMALDPQRLVVSVHDKDDEAYRIWRHKIGLPADRIYRYGDDENFWPADAPTKGPNGPCGPDSEMFFDTGVGCGRPTCEPRCDCRRFVEYWNLVFTQFNRKGVNVLEPLAQKNIDTGMGLERMARIMQGVASNFDIDIFTPILQQIAHVTGASYQRDTDRGARMRRIADHVRAVVFCLSDGVLFSNEGRGYVIRRLLRRCVRDGRELGVHDAFLYKLVPVVASVMQAQYPEIAQRSENLARYIQTEEERFHQTLEQGMRLLEERIASLRKAKQAILPGEQAFQLYDTFGFPLDLTELILQERGMQVDRGGFEQHMARQREQARKARGIVSIFGTGPVAKIKEFAKPTKFLGYDTLETEGKVLAIVHGEELVDRAQEGDELQVVLDRTSLYGESGGQVGDAGRLVGPELEVRVADTLSVEGYFLHVGRVTRGTFAVGSAVRTVVDRQRRLAIARNHTVTHILHFALREVLGKHVEQSGSLVAPDRMRFDYSHPAAPTKEELERIEDRANELILCNDSLSSRVTTLKEARKAGAMALFTEKYGEQVRLVSIGDYSHELCGGTHVERTGEIGLFKIVSESSIAAGFRRIEGVTGAGAIAELRRRDGLLARLGEALQSGPDQIVERAEALVNENRDLRRELRAKEKREVAGTVEGLLAQAEDVAGVKVLVAQLPDGSSAAELRAAIDALRKVAPLSVAALASDGKGKCLLICGATKDAVARGVAADKVVKEAAKHIGGGGGGRPDLAQAGGKNAAGIPQALALAKQLILAALQSS